MNATFVPLTVDSLRERLGELGVSLTRADESGVLDFTNRLLEEGALLTAEVGPRPPAEPLFRIDDPTVAAIVAGEVR